MHILLAQAFGTPHASLHQEFIDNVWLLWPSCTLEQLAALTPDRHDVTCIRALHRRKLRGLTWDAYDLVGISYFTATAPLAYQLADTLRARGIPVVLGGYHASALPGEALQHADAVVVGEAEKLWPRLLHDFENGNMQRIYRHDRPVAARRIPCTPGVNRALSPIGGIEATRGCRNHCDFCAISHSEMGRHLRLKSVEAVVDAIAAMPHTYFVFMDSSLNLSPGYTKKLFRAIAPLNKKFACFFNADVADDDELLKLAGQAGCIACAVGLETISQATINALDKQSNTVAAYGRLVERLHDHGIAVMSSLAFGFDNDTPDVFDTTLEKLNEWDVDSTGANILTPLPGTSLFSRLRQQGRILTTDWSRYDLYHVVFQPRHMSPGELYRGTQRFAERFYSLSSMLTKIFSALRLGYYPFLAILEHHLTSRLIYRATFREPKKQ